MTISTCLRNAFFGVHFYPTLAKGCSFLVLFNNIYSNTQSTLYSIDDERLGFFCQFNPKDEPGSLCIKIVSNPDKIQVFGPTYTYPVFGEDENIYGYTHPIVKLYYAAGSLATYLGLEYDSIKTVGKTVGMEYSSTVDSVKGSDLKRMEYSSLDSVKGKPNDVIGMIAKELSEPIYNYDEFTAHVLRDRLSFKPFGTKVYEYSVGCSTYELYSVSFHDAGFRAYHKRLQTFLLWFIEGASFLQDDDTRWEFTLLFERIDGVDGTEYRIAGYASYYPFFKYPSFIRMRISQFIILPPYQSKGHGCRLYSWLYSSFLSNDQVVDVTVEDPNDEFQNMRDKCDIHFLESKRISLPSIKPDNMMELSSYNDIHTKWKLGSRQANRVYEIMLLKRLNRAEPLKVRRYRLFLKQRLYRKNLDALASMDETEVKLVLDQTFRNIQEQYLSVIESL